MATGNLFGTGGESNSLYGNSLSAGGQIQPSSFIYFEWFIFRTSASQPATPTGGSWNFLSNTGTAPTGWTSFVSGIPLDNLWFSIAFVDSRNPTNIVWSTPGLISATTSVYATAYADTFTGDGVDTTWTLTADPVVVNNLDVSINGVTQTPTTDYTISGTTFTTTTPAPLGSIILVKYRQALPNSYFGTANNVGYTPFSWIAATNVQAALNEVATDISATDGVSGSNLVGFKTAGNGAVATTVQAKLRQTVSIIDFGADPTGVTSSSSAIQAAINSVGVLGSIIYPEGTYKISSTVLLLTQQHHIGFNAKIVVDSGVTAFLRTIDGFPGRIKFSDLRFEGTGNTGKAISITNNTPFVQLENCYFEDFARAVELSGSYCSNFSSCYFSYNLYGVLLLNECHSTQLINCFFDGNTYAGLAVNGTPTDGNLGTNVHNITSVGCSYQNSEFGVWVESCYEFAAYSTYHEGNSKADMRLGVGDAGVYNRFCYSFTVDSWQSSSPCASGKNIIMEHAVGGSLRGLAFNSGCSTTATLVEVDGFSDKIEIDYHRFTTVTPTTTAPFNFIGSAASRVAVFNDGRALYPKGMATAIRFGDLVAQPEGVYSGFTGSGRPALILESVGTNQDMIVKVTGIERHQNAAGVDKFYVDHVNSQTVSEYLMKSPLGIVMTTPDGTKNYRIWIDNSGNLTSTLV